MVTSGQVQTKKRMASIVLDSLLSFGNNLEHYNTSVKVQFDKESGSVELIRDAAKELESFKNLSVFPLVDIPTTDGWSAGFYVITGEFTPESVPFRDCGKVDNSVPVRFSVGHAVHIDNGQYLIIERELLFIFLF